MKKCKYCSNQVSKRSKNLCNYHRDKNNKSKQSLRKYRKENSLCVYCGKEVKNRFYCKECVRKFYEKYYRKDYQIKYRTKNRKKLNKQNLERYRKRKYSGNYYKVLERDNSSCYICKSTNKIIIHHIKKTDNSIDNLITLCQHCHNILHMAINNCDLEKLVNLLYKYPK